MYSIQLFSIAVKGFSPYTGHMKQTYVEIGLYDVEAKRLIWRVPLLSSHSLYTTYEAMQTNDNITLVWVQYHPEGESGIRVQLVSIYPCKLITTDYDMNLTIHPVRFRLTPQGSQYLDAFGHHVNPDEVIYPELLRLYLPDNNPVREIDDGLYYGIRLMARKVAS
jgi:hypothetical protein